MKRHFSALLLLVFMVTMVCNAQFQPAPVTKSEQKIIYQNKVFYVHTVQQNQTIYSICKAYGVTKGDISSANPDQNIEIIKPGMVLRIPDLSTPFTTEQSGSRKSRKAAKDSEFIYHTIEPKQTLYFLSKKYNVSEETILQYNPDAKNSLSIGQVIKIPKTDSNKNIFKIISEQPDAEKTYLVKEGDTLYNIAQDYNVSVASLIETNPDLRWGLKAGMILKIPGSSVGFYSSVDSNLVANSNKIFQYELSTCDSIKNLSHPATMKIALILPFQANEILISDTTLTDSITNHSKSRHVSMGVNCIEFYEGLLLALDSLKEAGKKISLFTFDTGKDTLQIRKILNELTIIKPDLIIGPVKEEFIEKVSVYSKENNVPMVLPFTRLSGVGSTNNPYIISMIPDSKTEMEKYARYLSRYWDQNIVVVHHIDTNVVQTIQSFKKTLFEFSELNYGKTPVHYREIPINDTLQRGLIHSLKKNMNNVIFITSGNEAHVVNLVGLLYIQSDYYNIKVLGLPSWQRFNNLRAEQIHRVETVLYSTFYIDYSKPQTIRFIQKSRNILGFEPVRINGNSIGFNNTYLGYETAMIFTEAFFSYGSSFINCACLINKQLPQSNYTFKESPDGGFSNNSINIIEFTKDYDVKLIEN